MKKVFGTLALVLASCVLFSACGKKGGELNVYSIIHDEETAALCNLFTKKNWN